MNVERSKTGLEFAPGTSEDCKKLVQSLVTPGDLFGAYRHARNQFKNGDLVLVISEQDPSGFQAEPRVNYAKRITQNWRQGAPKLISRIMRESAHRVMSLPFESEALWLVIVRGPNAIPIDCVIYATPYKIETAATN